MDKGEERSRIENKEGLAVATTPIKRAEEHLVSLDDSIQKLEKLLTELKGVRRGMIEPLKLAGYGKAITQTESETKKDLLFLEHVHYRMLDEKNILGDLIEIAKHLETQTKTLSETIEKIEKSDQKIKEIFSKIDDWMKYYQPILDEAKKEYDQLEKVQKI